MLVGLAPALVEVSYRFNAGGQDSKVMAGWRAAPLPPV